VDRKTICSHSWRLQIPQFARSEKQRTRGISRNREVVVADDRTLLSDSVRRHCRRLSIRRSRIGRVALRNKLVENAVDEFS
jgi:hypothetical protein